MSRPLDTTIKYELWVNSSRVYVGSIDTCNQMKRLYIADSKEAGTRVHAIIIKVSEVREIL